MFQQTVNTQIAGGVSGEVAFDSPTRAQAYLLNGTAPNTYGYAFTRVDDTTATAGGAGLFAGILINPKSGVSAGVGGNPLAPTLNAPNGTVGDCLTMGIVFVTLTDAANVGDKVIYANATGALNAITVATAVPSGFTLVPNAYVSRYSGNAAGGLAVITLTN